MEGAVPDAGLLLVEGSHHFPMADAPTSWPARSRAGGERRCLPHECSDRHPDVWNVAIALVFIAVGVALAASLLFLFIGARW